MTPDTTNTQTGLDEFQSDSDDSTVNEPVEDEPRVKHDASSTDAENTPPEPETTDETVDDSDGFDQSELSEVTVWETDSPATVTGATILHPMSGDFRSLTGSTGISKHRVKLVVDGVDAYLKENDCRQIDIPKYYSDYPDFDPVVTKRTAASNDGALGIHGPDLENVIRYIAGKGGFKHSELAVYVGHEHHYLLTYEDEAFLVYVDDISYPDDSEYNPTIRTVDGVDIPEDDPVVAAGFEQFFDAISEHHDLTVTGHRELIGSSHRFDVADDSVSYVQIRGHHLKRIARSTQDQTDITGEFEYETDFDETYTGEITLDDIEDDIGDERRDRHAIGYTKSVDDPRTTSTASLSGRVKVGMNTFYLLKRTTDTEYIRFEVRSRTNTVARFKPENKDYDPINDPLE